MLLPGRGVASTQIYGKRKGLYTILKDTADATSHQSIVVKTGQERSLPMLVKSRFLVDSSNIFEPQSAISFASASPFVSTCTTKSVIEQSYVITCANLLSAIISDASLSARAVLWATLGVRESGAHSISNGFQLRASQFHYSYP